MDSTQFNVSPPDTLVMVLEIPTVLQEGRVTFKLPSSGGSASVSVTGPNEYTWSASLDAEHPEATTGSLEATGDYSFSIDTGSSLGPILAVKTGTIRVLPPPQSTDDV